MTMAIWKPIRRCLISGPLAAAIVMAGSAPVLAQADPAGTRDAPLDLRALARALAEGNTGTPADGATPDPSAPRAADGAARQPDSPQASPPLPSSPPGATPGDSPVGDALDRRWPASAAALAELVRQRLEELGLDPAADQTRRRAELCVFLLGLREPEEGSPAPTAGCDAPPGN